MDEKRTIINSFMPKVVLKPMTEEAFRAIPQNCRIDGLIGIMEFPFRIGRESRITRVKGQLLKVERPKFEGSEPNNDLYLLDHGDKLNISREHIQVERVDGLYHIVDRGSICGTSVEDERIGGDGEGGQTTIKDGDTILIGCSSTPYAYQFMILEDASLDEEEE